LEGVETLAPMLMLAEAVMEADIEAEGDIETEAPELMLMLGEGATEELMLAEGAAEELMLAEGATLAEGLMEGLTEEVETATTVPQAAADSILERRHEIR